MFSTRDKGVPTAYFGAVFNDPRDFNIDSHQYFSLDYQHPLGKWLLDAGTSYDQARLQGPVPEAPANGRRAGSTEHVLLPGKLVDRRSQGKPRSVSNETTSPLGQRLGITCDRTRAISLNPPNMFSPEPNSSLISAVYVQDEFGITSRLTLNAGVRYDHYSTFGGTTNPRAALIFRAAQKTTFKLLYGNAFSAPDVYETSPDFGIFYDDNLKLQPEHIQSLEARVEQGLGQHFQLSSGVYRNRINDLITLVLIPA